MNLQYKEVPKAKQKEETTDPQGAERLSYLACSIISGKSSNSQQYLCECLSILQKNKLYPVSMLASREFVHSILGHVSGSELLNTEISLNLIIRLLSAYGVDNFQQFISKDFRSAYKVCVRAIPSFKIKLPALKLINISINFDQSLACRYIKLAQPISSFAALTSEAGFQEQSSIFFLLLIKAMPEDAIPLFPSFKFLLHSDIQAAKCPMVNAELIGVINNSLEIIQCVDLSELLSDPSCQVVALGLQIADVFARGRLITAENARLCVPLLGNRSSIVRRYACKALNSAVESETIDFSDIYTSIARSATKVVQTDGYESEKEGIALISSVVVRAPLGLLAGINLKAFVRAAMKHLEAETENRELLLDALKRVSSLLPGGP